MFKLPLFPLNTVLFPGMPLPLHIFEDRYKQMIQDCLDQDLPFGVVLILHGREAHGPLAEPHRIGCTARILDVQTISDGHLDITTMGQHRFRIISLNYDSPYLVGEVEYYPMTADDPDKLTHPAHHLSRKVREYMNILNEVEQVDLDTVNLPEDPLMLAHLAAVLLQTPPEDKQELLNSASALELLNKTNKMYSREIPLLRRMIHSNEYGEHDHIN
jgi:Lon protease-like protein